MLALNAGTHSCFEETGICGRNWDLAINMPYPCGDGCSETMTTSPRDAGAKANTTGTLTFVLQRKLDAICC